MTLIVKHKSVPNQSNQQLSLTETTGVFSTLNPGGYGALQDPAGGREIGDILSSNFNILNYNGTLTYEGPLTPVKTGELYSTSYNNTEAQAIANGTVQTLDLATLIGVNYVDAVYKSVYYNFFPGSSLISQGANSTTISVVDYNEFLNAKYLFIINPLGSSGTSVVEILSVNTDNTLTINIEQSIVANRICLIGYESTTYFANTYNINKCLHSKIAKLSLSNCSCKNKSTEKLYEAVMMYMSIQPNMDLGKYTKAQEIINALTIYCNGGECNC